MANTFLTPSIIAREALMVLRNNTVMSNLVHRDYSNDFVSGVGDTITIRKPATFTVDEFDRSSGIQVQDATEESTSITLDKHLDVSFEVTDEDLTMEIQDFSEQLLQPAMSAFAQKIDTYLTGLYADIPYNHGAAGTTPDAIDDITGVRKLMNNNKVPLAQRRLVINPDAEDKFLQLTAFHEADKLGSTAGLREASLGRKFGFDMYMDQNIADHTTGTLDDSSGGIAVKGAVEAGATAMTWDSASLTGTIVAGDMFTIDGIDYVVTDGATAASNEVAVKFYPAAAAIADNAEVTYNSTNSANNLAFHRNAFALVTRPLRLPYGLGNNQKAIVNYDGFGLRVIYDYDSTYKKDVVSIDMLCGVKTLDEELAVRLLG